MMSDKAVIPLESNPAVFNELAFKLGLSPVLQFHDVYSLTDVDLLAMIPQPIFGIIMLFPLTNNYETYQQEKEKGLPEYKNELVNKIKWLKQTIRNGCGLYALLHILLNFPEDLIVQNSMLSSLMSQLDANLSIEETTKLIENLESSIKLDENFGEKGQTEAPNANDEIYLHFISFIKGKDNHLYELDGRKKGPLDLGISVDDENLLNDPNLVNKVQFYINNADERNKHNFAIMAIGPSFD